MCLLTFLLLGRRGRLDTHEFRAISSLAVTRAADDRADNRHDREIDTVACPTLPTTTWGQVASERSCTSLTAAAVNFLDILCRGDILSRFVYDDSCGRWAFFTWKRPGRRKTKKRFLRLPLEICEQTLIARR